MSGIHSSELASLPTPLLLDIAHYLPFQEQKQLQRVSEGLLLDLCESIVKSFFLEQQRERYYYHDEFATFKTSCATLSDFPAELQEHLTSFGEDDWIGLLLREVNHRWCSDERTVLRVGSGVLLGRVFRHRLAALPPCAMRILQLPERYGEPLVAAYLCEFIVCRSSSSRIEDDESVLVEHVHLQQTVTDKVVIQAGVEVPAIFPKTVPDIAEILQDEGAFLGLIVDEKREHFALRNFIINQAAVYILTSNASLLQEWEAAVFKKSNILSIELCSIHITVISDAFLSSKPSWLLAFYMPMLKTIGNDCCMGSELRRITLSGADSFETIGDNFGAKCPFLDEVNFGKNTKLRSVGSNFLSESRVREVDLSGCPNLQQVGVNFLRKTPVRVLKFPKPFLIDSIPAGFVQSTLLYELEIEAPKLISGDFETDSGFIITIHAPVPKM